MQLENRFMARFKMLVVKILIADNTNCGEML